MRFFHNNRTTIGAIMLGVLLVVAYYVFWGSGSGSPLLSSSAAPSSESQQLLATLGDLHSVTLDNRIFKNQIFLSLSDFGAVIPEQPVGRPNPFAPVGVQTSPRSASSSGGGR